MRSSPVVRRRANVRRATITAVLLVSAVGHAVVVTTVHVAVPTVDIWEQASVVVAPLSYTCLADAALATAAQLSLCATPFSQQRAECTRKALVEHDLAATRCQAVEIATLDLSDPEVARQLAAPRPLVEDVAPVDDIVAAQLIEQEVAQKLEEAVKQMSRPDMSGQVVEITPPKVEIAPDRARYLSEYDSATKKETVARGSTEEMVEKPGPRALAATTKPPPLPEDAKPPAPKETTKPPNAIDRPEKQAPDRPTNEAAGVMAMRGAGQGEKVDPRRAVEAGSKNDFKTSSPDGYGPKLGDAARKITARTGQVGGTKSEGSEGFDQGGQGAGREVVPVPNLRPSEEILSRAVGGGSVDKLDGVEDDDETALNSRKWKYASFFNRMKRQVAQNWHPDEVYLRRDPTGKVYGTKDRLTILRVSLTPNGKLAKVYVAQQSGVEFLDEEAIRAFREAEPFPNPPGALVDQTSNLITFSFGFHFQIGDRSQWKVFRYK